MFIHTTITPAYAIEFPMANNCRSHCKRTLPLLHYTLSWRWHDFRFCPHCYHRATERENLELIHELSFVRVEPGTFLESSNSFKHEHIYEHTVDKLYIHCNGVCVRGSPVISLRPGLNYSRRHCRFDLRRSFVCRSLFCWCFIFFFLFAFFLANRAKSLSRWIEVKRSALGPAPVLVHIRPTMIRFVKSIVLQFEGPRRSLNYQTGAKL